MARQQSRDTDFWERVVKEVGSGAVPQANQDKDTAGVGEVRCHPPLPEDILFDPPLRHNVFIVRLSITNNYFTTRSRATGGREGGGRLLKY